jgi:transcriptional regulator with XRE-family HTH domain
MASMTGYELKERREGLGLSQEQLARELEVALSTVARWEQLKEQEIPSSKILKLALESSRSSELLKKAGMQLASAREELLAQYDEIRKAYSKTSRIPIVTERVNIMQSLIDEINEHFNN